MFPLQGVGPVIGMVDTVKIPSTLAPGKYVLGFRYDCEATAQVVSAQLLVFILLFFAYPR